MTDVGPIESLHVEEGSEVVTVSIEGQSEQIEITREKYEELRAVAGGPLGGTYLVMGENGNIVGWRRHRLEE